nr:MAG TPA: hypothetical protein [Caudoviricetes sp.]
MNTDKYIYICICNKYEMLPDIDSVFSCTEFIYE